MGLDQAVLVVLNEVDILSQHREASRGPAPAGAQARPPYAPTRDEPRSAAVHRRTPRSAQPSHPRQSAPASPTP